MPRSMVGLLAAVATAMAGMAAYAHGNLAWATVAIAAVAAGLAAYAAALPAPPGIALPAFELPHIKKNAYHDKYSYFCSCV